MAQLLINLCDIWTSQLCQRDNVRLTYTQALNIPSVNHGNVANSLFLYLGRLGHSWPA